MTEQQREMIEQFQCLGCSKGCSTKDDCFKPIEIDPGYPFFSCGAHVPGTMALGVGSFYLGLPKGFDKVGARSEAAYRRSDQPGAYHNLRLWLKDTSPGWNRLNVPVWAREKAGYLFVRTYLPRVNHAFIDVILGGTKDLVPDAIDVDEFLDEID